MAHQIEQPGRSLGVEQLGLHGDPARVGPGELMDGGHAARLGGATDDVMHEANGVRTSGGPSSAGVMTTPWMARRGMATVS